MLCHGQVESITTRPLLRVLDAGGQLVHEAVIEVEEPDNGVHKTPDAIVRHETRNYRQSIDALAAWIDANDDELTLIAVCHRVVHGGRVFERPVQVSQFVLDELETLVPLAPLHQPHNLEAIRVFQRRYGLVPHIAFFDTAFHSTQPEIARRFAIPRSLHEEGIERYGFHGISYAYIAHVLPEYLRDKAEGRVIVAHLGNGASLCAMHKRQSVATTMGFTALDGLMMGSRSGTIDPGVVLYLIQEKHMEPDAVARLLYYQSGLKGVSGISADMRELEASSDEEAQEAIALYVYQIVKHLGAMAAALGGVDAMVFTAGIGENSAALRRAVCEKLGWLGVTLEREANEKHRSCISSEDSQVAVFVIPTNEELMMAMQAKEMVA